MFQQYLKKILENLLEEILMAQILIQPINEICRSCTTLDFSLETQRASIVNRTTPIQFITCSGSWIVINPCHQNSLGWSYQCTKRCQIWEHCSEKGPYSRDRVPIRTFETFWVPIYFSGYLFSVFWLKSGKEYQFGLHVYTGLRPEE